MDALRRQQLNEIRNYDTDMNLRVLVLQRKQVALWGPEGGETSELLNQEVIDTANDSVRSLFVLLDIRRADVNTITRWHYHGSDKVYGDAVSTLGRMSEIVDTCKSARIHLSEQQHHAHTGHHTVIYKKDARVCV